MGNNGSNIRAQEETSRARISADAQVRTRQLDNQRQLDTEKNALNVRQAELQAQTQQQQEDHNHQQELERISNARKKQEDDHKMKLKDHELQTKKAENDHVVKLEGFQLEKEKVKSAHVIEMAQVEGKKEETKQVGEFLKALLDKPNLNVAEFAYTATTANSVIRNKEINIQALDTIASHQRMILEAQAPPAIRGRRERSQRRNVLRDLSHEDEDDEDPFQVINQNQL